MFVNAPRFAKYANIFFYERFLIYGIYQNKMFTINAKFNRVSSAIYRNKI